MKKLLQRLIDYWFTPMPAQRLALLRIASGSFALWYLLSRYSLLQAVARTDSSLFEPVGVAAWLSAPLSPEEFSMVYWATVAAGIAYTIGWRYRFSGPAFASLALFTFCYRNSWSMIYHDNIALILHIFIIAFSPAGDTYSVNSRRRTAVEEWHERYGWPVRLLCTATALTYLVAGLAKVLGDLRWNWADGSALRSQVAVDSLRKELLGESVSALFPWLYAHSDLFLLMGIFSLVVELGAPLFLVSRTARMGWALATWVMHWGIWLIMGITFRYQLSGFIFLPFFDVEILPLLFKSFWTRMSNTVLIKQASGNAIVLFDGVCHFCNRTVRFVVERDPKGFFQFASLQSPIGQSLVREHGLTPDLSTVVLIENNKAYTRTTAVLRICRRLSGLWPLLYLFIIVPKMLRDGVYAAFARYRYRWFGRYDICPVPEPPLRRRFLSEPHPGTHEL